MPSCHASTHQIDPNPTFLEILTNKYLTKDHDRKQCYMCVRPIGAIGKGKYNQIGKDLGWYYPPSEKCPNLNTHKSIFTGPNGEKWPGNKIAWLKTKADKIGGHPLVQMRTHQGQSMRKLFRINTEYKDPCGIKAYDNEFGVCWYAWNPEQTIQANTLEIEHHVNTHTIKKASIKKANDAVFGDPYPFDDGYYGYNGYGHYQLNGISTNTHDEYNNVLIFGIGILSVMMMLFCILSILFGISMVSFAVGKYWDRCFKPTSKNNTVGNHNALIESDLDQV